ncbi:MAG: ribokinase [Phycisphaerae bacterium]|nr:ribokinase [Phycisphaerae bacterium]
MRNRIVVVGSSNTDMIVQTPRIPRPGETILGGTFNTAAGGKGANQAVACARAGGQVTFVARVGRDMFGDQAMMGFRQDGINIDHVIRDETAPSGVALIIVDDQGENSIAVASGANGNLSVSDVEAAAEAIESAGIVLMQLETPIETIEAAAVLAVQNNVQVILNPAPAQVLSDALLRQITILTPNETEAEMLTGVGVHHEADAAKAAQVLIDRGVTSVIITMGASGAYVHSAEFQGMVPGFSVSPVDTTAAGDTFNGTLAVALAEGKALAEAVTFANAAAALSVTVLGAQPSAPDRNAIEQFLKKNKS